MRFILVSGLLLLMMTFFSACNNDPAVAKTATAYLYRVTQMPDNDRYVVTDSLAGEAVFYEENGSVSAVITLRNFPPNSSHGLHLHEGTCETPGGHWNQGNAFAYCEELSNGQPWGKPYVGDIGNIRTDESGTGSLTLTTDLWSVNTDDVTDILGRIVVVHNHAEDFVWQCRNNSLPAMHMNPKVACGEVILHTID